MSICSLADCCHFAIHDASLVGAQGLVQTVMGYVQQQVDPKFFENVSRFLLHCQSVNSMLHNCISDLIEICLSKHRFDI